MTIKLHISDADYRDLVSNPRRMRGTIGLISPKTGTFHRHAYGGGSRGPKAPGYRFQKLKHGRVSITDEWVHLHLNIERRETDICASECIDEESRTASDFVFEQIEQDY